MYFSSNIKFLRKRKGRTQDDVAHALGFKRSTLSGYENRVAHPSISALVALSDFYNLAIDSLIKVDLQVLTESQLTQLENGFDVFVKGSRLRVLVSTVDSDNNENIELVPEKAKAGYATGYADPDFINELPVFQLPFLSKEKKYRTFQISGDSMLPIPDGVWVTGEFVQDWHSLKNGELYVVTTLDEGVVFKLVENNIEKDQNVILHSLNPLYEPYEIEVAAIKEIWKFVHFISAELPEVNSGGQGRLVQSVLDLKGEVDSIKSKMGL